VAERNVDKWINLSEVLSFNKMRVLMRDASVDDLVTLIRKPGLAKSYELSKDGTMVRKKGISTAQTKKAATANKKKVLSE